MTALGLLILGTGGLLIWAGLTDTKIWAEMVAIFNYKPTSTTTSTTAGD